MKVKMSYPVPLFHGQGNDGPIWVDTTMFMNAPTVEEAIHRAKDLLLAHKKLTLEILP